MARRKTHMLRHGHVLQKYFQRIPSPSVFLFLFAVVLIASLSFFTVNFTQLEAPHLSATQPNRAISGSPSSVTIWYPTASCSGTFTSTTAVYSDPPFPSAVIREAVIDRRYLSRKQFRDVHPSVSYMRIILYMTVHLSVSLTREDAVAQLLVQKRSPSLFRAHVDYVTRVDPFLIRGRYKPGKKTKRGNQVSEWQVAVSIRPMEETSTLDQTHFMSQVMKLANEDGAILSLVLPLKRFDGVVERFDPAFDLRCVTDWHTLSVYPAINKLQAEPGCYNGIRGARGAVLVSGSALYGKKKITRTHYREVAHFAARALRGPLQFETVAMSVVVNNSYSDREHVCGEDSDCHSTMLRRNYELLQDVRQTVEHVFEEIELERSVWSRLMLVPFGRLGSDANGTEAADAGRSSHRYGQYHATFFTYAMLSPFYKWAMSYDMDEFVGPTPSSGLFSAQNAEDVLDGLSKRRAGHMFFPWLNFLMPDGTANNLTRQVMSGRMPTLKGGNKCYGFTRDATGKAAVRCDVGLGFTIHRPVIRVHSLDPTVLKQVQGEKGMKKLRTWHPRIGGSRGKCCFAPGG